MRSRRSRAAAPRDAARRRLARGVVERPGQVHALGHAPAEVLVEGRSSSPDPQSSGKSVSPRLDAPGRLFSRGSTPHAALRGAREASRGRSLAARRETTVATRRTKRSVRLIATQNARSRSRRLISRACVLWGVYARFGVCKHVCDAGTRLFFGWRRGWLTSTSMVIWPPNRINNTPYAPP